MNGFPKAALALLVSSVAARADVHFGNGIKIGEVDATSAITMCTVLSSTRKTFLNPPTEL